MTEQEDSNSRADPAATLQQLLGGFQSTQALHVAAKLGIFDRVHPEPKTAAELSRDVGAHEPSLRRLLSALVSDQVLKQDGTKFGLTPTGDLLRASHPQSQQPWALLLGSPLIWRPWGDLYESVMTGRPAFELQSGQSFFEHLADAPEDAAVFNAAMTSDSSRVDAILRSYDFQPYGRIVDVGGGQGELLASILARNPESTGVLFDLPFVVAQAEARSEPALRRRCAFVAGSMFDSVPADGDLYILKRIIHDWADEEAIQLLQCCRNAMTARAKLILMEHIVGPSNAAATPDLMMLVLVSGHERTEQQFSVLLAAAGLRLERVIRAGTTFIIEAAPV